MPIKDANGNNLMFINRHRPITNGDIASGIASIEDANVIMSQMVFKIGINGVNYNADWETNQITLHPEVAGFKYNHTIGYDTTDFIPLVKMHACGVATSENTFDNNYVCYGLGYDRGTEWIATG
jgi:hypothetical protein